MWVVRRREGRGRDGCCHLRPKTPAPMMRIEVGGVEVGGMGGVGVAILRVKEVMDEGGGGEREEERIGL